MAEELVRLTNQNDEMEEKVKEIPKLKIQLKVSAVNFEYSLRDWKRCYIITFKPFRSTA